MDEDLKQFLNEFRAEQAAAHEETRRYFDKRLGTMDQRFDGMDQRFDGVDQRLDGVDQRLDAVDQRFDAMDRRVDKSSEENAAAHAETRRQVAGLGVMVEGLRHQIGVVADGYAMNTEALQRLEAKFESAIDAHDVRITRLEVTVARLEG